MTALAHLPQIDDTAKFIGDLLGSQVKGTECTDFDADKVVVFAEYTDDDDATNHFVACDITAGAILGAALTGVPPSLVEETVADGSMPENLLENLQEVLNISVNVFPQSEKHRIALDSTTTGDQAVEKYKANGETPKVCMTLDVPRYGSGVLVIGAS
jgi:hypothetical protein